ncbi:arginine utilization regulatory protein [Dethiosulfatibacter aminovorans DSM 17477]|uniref:Arginine utilization regulatory protein n=1 Tax=Dethiosulfatibacter aminovorans DSM 17477 TaxID=1121476 RepID=A0A1M6JFC3_9FIRM|nr:sigma 54-interacting transcriptional regulator [Dethiosulfatibacter aminovorans]SHJ45398.1 arginine utilization regulatory protein [Dethiosulfatibacter aminovorans DSM 17477]
MFDEPFEFKFDILKKIMSDVKEEVVVVDENLRIIYANHCEKQFGMKESQVINKSIYDAFLHLQRNKSSIQNVFRNKKSLENNICSYVTRRGEKKTKLTSTYPIFDGERVRAVYEIGEDVPELHLNKLVPGSRRKAADSSKGFKDELSGKGDRLLYYTVDSIAGSSNAVVKLREKIKNIANSPSSILIYGETGTGKELAAQAVYTSMNNWQSRPFVVQNCAAIPETLLESILFGTVKGSFTGAENRPGLFEESSGGILFLDELNSMPLSLQAKILRVLQEGKVRRVGGEKEIDVDFRLIATTNVRPEILVKSGELREDLYYRISVLNLDLVPLRERKNDIPKLVDGFIAEFNSILGKNIERVDRRTMEFFMNYSWPGNIRELKNIVERLSNYTNCSVITYAESEIEGLLMRRESIPEIEAGEKKETQSKDRIRLREAMAEYEKELLAMAIEEAGGNVSRAARDLDIPQQTMNNKVIKYDLKKMIEETKLKKG